MLLTHFSFIWVFQILIGYSKFLRNAYLRILLFSNGYFRRCEWKLLSVSISGMSILIENWGYDSESWSDTLRKQFNNGINIT